jgi:hypothetical protein
MSQPSLLFDKAAACERKMHLSTEPQERSALKIVHEMWRVLIEESALMSPHQLMAEIATLEEIQSAAERLVRAPAG